MNQWMSGAGAQETGSHCALIMWSRPVSITYSCCWNIFDRTSPLQVWAGSWPACSAVALDMKPSLGTTAGLLPTTCYHLPSHGYSTSRWGMSPMPPQKQTGWGTDELCYLQNSSTHSPVSPGESLVAWWGSRISSMIPILEIHKLRFRGVWLTQHHPTASKTRPSEKRFITVTFCFSRYVISDSVNLRTVSLQAPLSMGFLRQEYWSGLPFPSPGDLPDPGIEPRSPPLQADFLWTEPQGTPFHRLEAKKRGKTYLLNFNHQKQSCVLSLSRVRLFMALWTIAHQPPLSMGIFQARIEVCCHDLLQRLFPTQGSNLGLLHCGRILLPLSHYGSPKVKLIVLKCLNISKYSLSFGRFNSHSELISALGAIYLITHTLWHFCLIFHTESSLKLHHVF